MEWTLLQRARRRLRGEDRDPGFGLVEVVVAIGVFAAVAVAVAGLTVQALRITANSKERSVAANLASQEVDEVRAISADDIRSLPTGRQITYYDTEQQLLPASVNAADDRVAYTVTRRSEWVAAGATNSPCQGGGVIGGGASGAGALSYLSVQVEVSWARMNGVEPVRTDTVITPAVGIYDPNSGNLPVKVFDRDGAPVQGATVAATRVSNSLLVQTATTDETGCAFLAFLPPTTYDVAVSKPGHVDKQGKRPRVERQTVNAGQTSAALVYEIDRASSFVATAGSTTYPLPCNTPITIANASLDPPTKVVALPASCPTGTLPSPSASRPANELFPFSNGYDAWLGDCRDAEPASYSAVSNVNFPVTRGNASPPKAVLGREIRILVTNGSSVARPNLKVQLFRAAETGVGARCTTARVLELGSTAADGTVKATVPYGSWVVRTGDTPTVRGAAVAVAPVTPATVLNVTRSF